MKDDSMYEIQYNLMTNRPVGRLILSLAVPSTITILITHIYNLIDTYFVGKLGTSASGAVGIVFGVMAILQAFGFMYGQGAGNMMSRLLGAKEEERASQIVSVALFAAAVTGITISIIGVCLMKPILYGLGSTVTIFPFARAYGIWIFLAAPFILCSLVLNNLFRYQGRANMGLIGIGTGAILNMCLDPILMFACNLGITGAGISTAVSQFLGFIVLMILFQSHHSQQHFQLRQVRSFFKRIGDISITGLPALLRQGLGSVSTMLLNRQACLYGDSAVAAMSIVGRISFFIFAVGLGIAQGYQPMAGFNYGAKKYERVRKGFFFTLMGGELLLGLFAIAGMIFSQELIGIFRDDISVIEIGSSALIANCIGVFFLPLTVCTNVLLQSAGVKKGAAFTAIMRSGLFFIPLIIILPAVLGLQGIKFAQPVADFLACLSTLPFAIHFSRRHLKNSETDF